MTGQFNIFDFIRPEKRRPCDYGFFRYIGQQVRFCGASHKSGTRGLIKSIMPYYTIVSTKHGELVGTPTTIAPVKEEQE